MRKSLVVKGSGMDFMMYHEKLEFSGKNCVFSLFNMEKQFSLLKPFFPKQFTVEVLNSFLQRCPACSRWWCPALPMSRIHVSPLVAIHLSPNLAGGVRLSGCLQCICLPLRQVICLPIWLVVSSSLAVSNSFVSPCGKSFVS